MPRSAANEETFVQEWMNRIQAGEKAKKEWEEQYEVDRCKEYWTGDQLEQPEDEFHQRRVQVNKVHPSVKSKLPALYFGKPFARVKAEPALADTPGQPLGRSIDDKAQLLQDQANTLIRDVDVNFEEATQMALKESMWAFGAVRIRYDAIPVENPAAEAPPVKEKKDTKVRSPKKRLGEVLGLNVDSPEVKSERFYVQRIPARQVLCSADQSGTIQENGWFGYWAVVLTEDVKRSGLYKNIEDLKPSTIMLREDTEKAGRSEAEGVASDKTKLFHIWTTRDRMHYVFAEGHKRILLEHKYKRRGPMRFLRPDVDPDCFYPIPPIYHQLHPQDEINDSREWLRLNRKGTVPRFTYDKEAIEPADMKKLESGEMGTYIPRKPGSNDPIQPVNQPNYSNVAGETYRLASREFDELSQVSSEARGVPRASTATQAKISEIRSQAEEAYDRDIVAKFLAEIVEELIWLSIDKMSVKHWILKNADPDAEGFAMEAMKIASMWQEITSDDLEDATDGVKWHVSIESSTMSPVAEKEEREEWLQTLSLLGNEVMAQLLFASPELRKKTLMLNGIRSARDQELFGESLKKIIEMRMQMAAMGGPPSKGLGSQPGAPPGMGSPGASPVGPKPPNEDRVGGGPPPPEAISVGRPS